MKKMMRHLHKAVLLLVIALVAAGCSHDEGEETLTYDPEKEPVRIGICVPAQGESDEYSKMVLDGIRMANEIKGVINDARITLVMKDSCDMADLNAVCKGMVHDGLQGLICSAGGTKQNSAAFDAEDGQGSITVMVGRNRMNPDTDVQVFRLGSTLIDQARTAALFAVQSLGAGRVAVVLDQKSSSSVLLASLFSSELINAGGRIENIAYVGDGSEELESAVVSMLQHNPDVVYMPYSEDNSHMVISLVKRKGFSEGMIISNVLFERRFLDKGGRDLDGVYLITDFHPGAVQTKRGAALLEKYAGKHKDLGALETCSALGSEAYFLLCDLLSLPQDADAVKNADKVFASMESISGITGVAASGRITKSMHACQIHSGIIRGIRTVYKGSINPL
ncbi:MAG: ABC transporter substrate-binding protein [Deltaproteobacteria bacterium]|nr:ABC transporter substrate-binding protein [Deltaproteobacteria bacterium]